MKKGPLYFSRCISVLVSLSGWLDTTFTYLHGP